MSAGEPIFQPLDEITSRDWAKFRDHYGDCNPPIADDNDIRSFCYGGEPLTDLYSHFHFEDTDEPARTTTIRLKAANGGADLVIRNLSMKQFLVTCHRGQGFDRWLDGRDHWKDLTITQRLELCHSELSRWSIVLKDDAASGFTSPDIEGGDHYSKIELVNNCTTTKGFEFKVRKIEDGKTYHGSFGREDNLKETYERLSRYQSGSLAKQDEKLNPSFWGRKASFNMLFHYWRLGSYDLAVRKAPDIDTDNYRYANPSGRPIAAQEVTSNLGRIEYESWGVSEYHEKPKKRKLMVARKPRNGALTKDIPETYRDIRDAEYIEYPNFDPTGVYNISRTVKQQNYRWLYEIDTCFAQKLGNGDLYEFELRRARSAGPAGRQLRRIIVGNVALSDIKRAGERDPFTFFKFGYGARPATMRYDPNFVPAGEQQGPVPYAYLLAGKARQTSTARTYVHPEGFGVERLILSWKDPSRKILEVDIMGFERILPIWKGEVAFPAPLS